MDFEISSENKLIADTVRRFIQDRLAPLEAGIDAADEIDPAVIPIKSVFSSCMISTPNMQRALQGLRSTLVRD